MYLTKEKKAEIIATYAGSATNTGAPEAQIALFTYRINHLTNHLKTAKKDKSTELALKKLVGKRKRLLDYLQRIDIERYRAIVDKLNLRK
ncbi:MAG: 30S ribosomal protein S15 [Bacteroidia bacterium]|nr:30S ribosomal protein S15 [Bacteroidia bacterium]MDW8301444.1 30S ribosomal protein S15 [Bacteroidia bacterium]